MNAFLSQSSDGLGIILKLVLEFAIENWRTNCRLKNVDYGRVLAQSNDGFGIILEFFGICNWRLGNQL